MQTLKAGDVRQEGDEHRHQDLSSNGYDCQGRGNLDIPFHEEYRPLSHRPHKPQPGHWKKVNLVGWPILQSDLMIFDYRRP